MVAMLGKYWGTSETSRAEAIAARDRLRFAFDFGIRKIILEGDAKLIIDSFERNSVDLSYNGNILADAYRLATKFNFFKANFVPRRCNMVADRIASLANMWDHQNLDR